MNTQKLTAKKIQYLKNAALQDKADIEAEMKGKAGIKLARLNASRLNRLSIIKVCDELLAKLAAPVVVVVVEQDEEEQEDNPCPPEYQWMEQAAKQYPDLPAGNPTLEQKLEWMKLK